MHSALFSYFSCYSCTYSNGGHGKIAFDQLGRAIAEKWKVASEEIKEDCLELAREDRIRFETEMAEYKATRKFMRGQGRLKEMEEPERASSKKRVATRRSSSKGAGDKPVIKKSPLLCPPVSSLQETNAFATTPGSADAVHNLVPQAFRTSSRFQNNLSKNDLFSFPTQNLDPLPLVLQPAIPPDQYDPLLNVAPLVKQLDKPSRDFIIRAFLH